MGVLTRENANEVVLRAGRKAVFQCLAIGAGIAGHDLGAAVCLGALIARGRITDLHLQILA